MEEELTKYKKIYNRKSNLECNNNYIFINDYLNSDINSIKIKSLIKEYKEMSITDLLKEMVKLFDGIMYNKEGVSIDGNMNTQMLIGCISISNSCNKYKISNNKEKFLKNIFGDEEAGEKLINFIKTGRLSDLGIECEYAKIVRDELPISSICYLKQILLLISLDEYLDIDTLKKLEKIFKIQLENLNLDEKEIEETLIEGDLTQLQILKKYETIQDYISNKEYFVSDINGNIMTIIRKKYQNMTMKERIIEYNELIRPFLKESEQKIIVNIFKIAKGNNPELSKNKKELIYNIYGESEVVTEYFKKEIELASFDVEYLNYIIKNYYTDAINFLKLILLVMSVDEYAYKKILQTLERVFSMQLILEKSTNPEEYENFEIKSEEILVSRLEYEIIEYMLKEKTATEEQICNEFSYELIEDVIDAIESLANKNILGGGREICICYWINVESIDQFKIY